MNSRRNRNENDQALTVLQPPRLPYQPGAEQYGVDAPRWKALVEAIFPAAKSVDGVMLALAYCQSRNLDPFKRAVHIVPMYNSALGREVETVWPGISELRTTASRTRGWAGNDACTFGPTLQRQFEDSRESTYQNQRNVTRESCPAFRFPEWAQMTVYRMVFGNRVAFVGPKVYFTEAFSGTKGLRVPNARWQQSPFQMLEKCAEAAALRRAFPEEMANDYTAEEMEGHVLNAAPTIDAKYAVLDEGDNSAGGDEKPTRESVEEAIDMTDPANWPVDVTDSLASLSRDIDRCEDPDVLRRERDKWLPVMRDERGWPEPAVKELEIRFNTRIRRMEGEIVEEDAADGETAATDETDSAEGGNDE